MLAIKNNLGKVIPSPDQPGKNPARVHRAWPNFLSHAIQPSSRALSFAAW
jgi:hypothetical protein